ncbi:MAG: phenylalanine--tRNA ligase subunit beta [Bacteroidales bacterium]|nr:MAG: phenylalanine--tRNA ligase subunit beta [Bacteroidales bacterium]
MTISYSWLKEYIKIDIEPEKVAQILTSIGLEVESIEKHQTVKGGLEGVVIGEVLTCEKHPDADKLSKTTVNIGLNEPLHVVCGAPNVAQGQKVAVATVGAKLYFNDQEIVIKKAKIRGELSEGMICAEDELGLGTSHAGIMVLDQSAVVGTPAKDYFKIEDDYIFEIGLTPNRIDAASHYGVARDIAAYLNLEKPTKAVKPSVESFRIDNNKFYIPVEVVDPTLCSRFSGVTISNIKIGPSPEWLKKKLKSIGLNPIYNVVDVTNFVLHEIGQPLHAYNADEITGNKVIVKTLNEGTPFVTLDSNERKLSSEDLMVCNTEQGMCIAGVFGGLKSGVSETTTKIFLEAACFNPISVRKTARRYGLNTDASFRFERGTDPNITLWALKRAAILIQEVAGGEISSEIVDVYSKPVEDFKVEYNLKRATTFIGKEIPLSTIKKILEGLEIKVVKEDNESLQLAVPPYRVDVQREADIVEEILRIYGYNNVEFSEKVNSTLSYSKKPDTHQIINLISDYLTSNGFNETMCNSLTKLSYYKDLNTYPVANTVQIMNPLSNDLSGMRQTLLFGGLESVQRNTNHRNLNLKLYEFGNCYKFSPDADRSKKPLKSYSEDLRLGIWLAGEKTAESWIQKPQAANFYTIKGYVHSILARFGIDTDSLTIEDAPSDIFEYGLSYSLKNKPLVTFGLVNRNILESFDLKAEVFFAELKWNLVFDHSVNMKIVYKELPKFPEVKRDLALLLDKNITYGQIQKLAFATERKLLKRVNLFDVYEGKNLGENKKSYAVSFILMDESKTLTDVQIDKTMNTLIEVFGKELGAQIR